MAKVLVEQRFDPALSDEEYGKLAKKVDPCLDQVDAIWCRSYISADKKRVICEFEAADAETVRQAYLSAGVPTEAVWTAGAVFCIEDYPEWIAKREAVRARLSGR